MTLKEIYRLEGKDSVVSNVKLATSPYKYFHVWKYDSGVLNDLSWVTSYTINDQRGFILEKEARESANSTLNIVNWIFAIYILLYLLNSARKWLYKK